MDHQAASLELTLREADVLRRLLEKAFKTSKERCQHYESDMFDAIIDGEVEKEHLLAQQHRQESERQQELSDILRKLTH